MMQRPEDRELTGLAKLFEDLAAPDWRGVSRQVSRDEFVGEYAALDSFGNGGNWCRSDGPLGKKYIVERPKEKGRIAAVQLLAYNHAPLNNQTPMAIRKAATQSARCVVLASGTNLEADHKDGRKNQPRQLDMRDYQPMSKAANDAKRQHCDRCSDTNKRFDATQLGYSVGFTAGSEKYQGTCVGCYWYNPQEFNAIISAGYNPS